MYQIFKFFYELVVIIYKTVTLNILRLSRKNKKSSVLSIVLIGQELPFLESLGMVVIYWGPH